MKQRYDDGYNGRCRAERSRQQRHVDNQSDHREPKHADPPEQHSPLAKLWHRAWTSHGFTGRTFLR